MGKIRKVIGALLMITALLVTQIPAVETSAAPSSDFQINKTTLVKYTGTASSVTIPSSVEVIGAEAFAGNTSLTAVSIGKNVKEIEYGAFKDCTYLNSVSLPETLTTIGNAVFSNDTSLKKITLPKSLENLGSGVFAGCDSLSSINISKENPNFVFEKNVLYDKAKTKIYCYAGGSTSTSYSMPDTVVDIDEYAFWGNDTLQEIQFGVNIQEIPSYAFSNCRNLLAVSIPYSVKSIQSKAFENCISLQKVIIPASVSYIHSTAFDGCPKLVISADSGSAAHEFYENWKITNKTEVDGEKDEGDTVVDSGGNVYVVGSNGKLELVQSGSSSSGASSAEHDPSNVDYVPQWDPLESAEDGVLAKTIVVGQSAVLMMDSPGMQVISGITYRDVSGEEDREDSLASQEKGEALPKYAVVNDRITEYAYYGDGGLTTYTIPSNITKIGDFAFARSGLKSINIPKGVTTIGYAAFYHCDDLKEISIPETVTWIDPSAFAYTGWLDAWASNASAEDFLIVGDGILLAYKGSAGRVKIPNTVKTIAPSCFMGHTEITEVVIPDSIAVIGEEAFQDCTSLQMVEGANGIETIQDRAFANTALQEFHVGKYVKEIGVGAFSGGTDGDKTVYFDGEEIPALSITPSTSRLSNDLLAPAFSKQWTAVLQSADIETKDTVLGNAYLGFTGKIAVEKEGKSPEVLSAVSALDAGEDRIQVSSDVSEWATEDITARLSYSGEYHLYLEEGEFSDIQEAFQRIYGKVTPEVKVFDMTLRDRTDTVGFTKFGSKPLEVTVPLPTELKGNTIHVAALDQDGQMEKLASSLVQEEGRNWIRFSTEHLSTFAIYAMGEDGTVQIADGVVQTTVSGRKDYTPNTGDHSIHPKWFAALGIAAAAVGLMAYKPKRKKVRR